jgi:hypothetical protein
MSDTARSYQPNQPADNHGWDDFFAAESCEGVPQELPVGVPEGVPVELASSILGLTDRAVLKRLRRGTLEGFKIKTKYGEKWLVSRKELPVGLPSGSPTSGGLDSAIEISLVSGTPEELPGIPVVQSLECEGLPLAQATELDKLCDLVALLQEKLEKANEQLQGATFRNGFLEAKLEEKENQILLLTDSKGKQGWWARFSSWFFLSR